MIEYSPQVTFVLSQIKSQNSQIQSTQQDFLQPVSILSDSYRPFSPNPSFTTDSDDAASLFSASTITSSSVNIPDTWGPTIMACLIGDLAHTKKY